MSNSFDPQMRSREHKKIIAEALHEHSKLTTRQENDPDADIGDLFTDNRQLLTLEKTDWQILYGRRGTGKTTLLHKLSNVIDKKTGLATLSLSLQKCVVDLPKDTPDSIRGLVQFEKFVMEIGFLLYRIYTNRTAAKNRYRKLATLMNLLSAEQKIINSAILQIATFAQRGVVFGAMQDKTVAVESSRKTELSRAFGAKADLSFLKGAEQFSAYANAQIHKSLKGLKEAKYKETAHIDFSELKRDFTELLDALGIKTLFILVDEWSALDNRASPKCQVYFAEYLKRAFFGTSRICVKISAIEHESRFEALIEGERIGLEVGADVFVQVNLDEIYNNRTINLKEFFSELIYKRLRHCVKDIEIFRSKDGDDKPIEDFLDLMFEDKIGFDEIVRASSGIPRDFINKFDALAADHDYTVEKKWKKHRIQDVIIRDAIRRVADHIEGHANLEDTFGRIGKLVAANADRLFLASRKAPIGMSASIESLFASRLIHRVDAARVPSDIRSEYTAYYIDYGVYLDLLPKKSRNGDADVGWPWRTDPPESEFKRYVVG